MTSTGRLFSSSSSSNSNFEMVSRSPLDARFRTAFFDRECGVPGSLGCRTRPFRFRMELRRLSKPPGESFSAADADVDSDELATAAEEEEEEVTDVAVSLSQKT